MSLSNLTPEEDKILECSICLAEFFKPKKLPCLHSFCLACLQKYCEHEIDGDKKPCPLCKREFIIPPGGADNLSDDEFLIRQVLEKGFRNGKQWSTKCELCITLDEEVEAEAFCMECRQRLCARCKKLHTSQNSTRLHKIVSMQEKPSEEELQRLMSSHCSVHNNEEIKLYCCDCRLLMCLLCHATGHNTHLCKVPQEIAQERCVILVKDSADVDEWRNDRKEKLNGLVKENKDFLLQVTSVESSIKQSALVIRNLAEICETEFYNKLIEIKTDRLKEIQSQKDLEELHYTELDSFLAYSRMVIKRGTDCEIIRAADELHARADELIEAQDEYNKQKLAERELKFVQSCEPRSEDVKILMGRIAMHENHSDSDSTCKPLVSRPDFRGKLDAAGKELDTDRKADNSDVMKSQDHQTNLNPAIDDTKKQISGRNERLVFEMKNVKEVEVNLPKVDECAEQLEKLKEEFKQLKALNDRYYVKYITSPNTKVDIIQHDKIVRGVTVVDDEIFVARSGQSHINVYDSQTLQESRVINVPDMRSTWGLAGCPFNRALYISDRTLESVHKVNLTNDIITCWNMTADHWPWGISLTSEHNILVTLQNRKNVGENILAEYTNEGQLVLEIKLDASIQQPRHTVQLSSDHAVYCLTRRWMVQCTQSLCS